MTREEMQREILSLEGSNWLLELATGTGKSKMALEKIKQLSNNNGTLLIVVNRNVHKDNWATEIKKWWPNCGVSVVFITYKSFPNLVQGDWDYIIFDECHHLSERCREAVKTIRFKHSVLLSATVNNKLKIEFNRLFPDLVTYKKDLRDVIGDEILPDPKVYLLQLELDTTKPTEVLMFNPKSKKKVIKCNWADRWKYIKQKEYPVRVYCTQRQYLSYLNSQVDYWKKKATGSQAAKNRWLKLCGERLKWLSDKKLGQVLLLLKHFNGCRTLTFCYSIEQTEKLGEHCINSKNKVSSTETLTKFNTSEVDHITACNMLNEGMNLVDCQVGIYANLNSSETIIKQRMGRLLRHPEPILVVPYYKNSRDEELVNLMVKDYNPELVTTITKIEEIKI